MFNSWHEEGPKRSLGGALMPRRTAKKEKGMRSIDVS